MPKRTADTTYRANRALILQGNPPCHWCGGIATEADHLIEHAIGGTDEIENLVASCKKCNSTRGALFQAKRKTQTKQQRTTPQTFFYDTPLPPTLGNSHSFFGQDQPELAGTEQVDPDWWKIGREQPRLESVSVGGDTYGPLIAAWALKFQGIFLMPWQVRALSGQFSHDANGDFVYRESLCSTSRQCGKSTALTAAIGWFLTEYSVMRGRSMNVLSVANRLDRAESLFPILAPVLVEFFGAKQLAALGRKSVTLPNGSTWEIRAANKNLHGGSFDLIICDELFDIEGSVVDSALRPSQIARKSPLLSMWSTAGDESSTVMIQLREQALADIDAGRTSLLYFAEWSMPQVFNGETVNPMDETFWRWANPALGTTITIEALRAVSKKDSFMRAHLNQWQSARGGWLEMGAWDKCKTTEEYPEGTPSVLAIDSSIDDARFVGVQSTAVNGSAFVKIAFICETETDMWQRVMAIMEDSKVELAVTPSLEIHIPVQLQKRYQTVGYSELVKMTTIARTMIHEKRVMHNGQESLSEHIARAVGVKTPAGYVVSSQKSAGPIELARMAIFSICLSTKPVQRTRAMLVIAK